MPARLVEITSGELTLAGVLHTPEGDGPFSAVVVCHPHPRMGGDMTSNVVLAAVEGLAAQGIAALRFNFRGSGASEGTHDDGKGERDDVRAALSFAADLGELDATRIGLAGYSFGAGMSAAVASDDLPALALIAMPLSMAALDSPLLTFTKPLLMMAGDLDEYCEAGALEEFGTEIGAQVTTQVVEGADHFWGGFEGTIRSSVGEFFAAAL
jgi:alpha/beta superfamily hydrolase